MDLVKLMAAGIDEPTEIYVIAEVGINHNGDLEIAKRLIREAARVGCDAVKFQKRTINIVYSPELLAEPRESPWGKTQRAQKEGLEFNAAQYSELRNLATELGIDFSASAWDLESLKFVHDLKPEFHKVASAFITNIEFLEAVAKLGLPTFISTGMCTLEQIDKAVQIFERLNCPFMLMHTVSVYPAKLSSLNMKMIGTLQDRYSKAVGYSGHESNVSPTLCAAALGAKAIERHFTLDRTMYGSDQAASLEPDGLQRLVAGLRKYPEIIGDGVKRFDAEEVAVARKLRYWES
jgi:N-acetylneuraminate synthase